MKTLLIANTEAACGRLRYALGGEYRLVFATTLHEAGMRLSEGCDAILCGIHFADSQLYTLLHMAKETQITRHTPFVGIRVFDDEQAAIDYRLVESTLRALGGSDFIDLIGIEQQFGWQTARNCLKSYFDELLVPDPTVCEPLSCLARS